MAGHLSTALTRAARSLASSRTNSFASTTRAVASAHSRLISAASLRTGPAVSGQSDTAETEPEAPKKLASVSPIDLGLADPGLAKPGVGVLRDSRFRNRVALDPQLFRAVAG